MKKKYYLSVGLMVLVAAITIFVAGLVFTSFYDVTNIVGLFRDSPLFGILTLFVMVLLIVLIDRILKSLKLKHSLIILAVVLIFLTSLGFALRDDIGDLFMYQKICMPNPSNDKVAVIIAKDGIYDNQEISLQVSKYFDSVKKDLNIDNAGLQKFGGKTFHELDLFVDELYSKHNVGYIIFVGDDLPILLEQTTEIVNESSDSITYRLTDSRGRDEIMEISRNMTFWMKEGTATILAGDGYKTLGQQLGCINGDCDLNDCKDVGISFILPPLLYSNDEKVNFVSNVLTTYTNYHENFAEVSKKYQKSLLYAVDYSLIKGQEYLGQHKETGMGYNLPLTIVFNNESRKMMDELEKKHIVLSFYVHGTETIQQLILRASDFKPEFESINPSTSEGWMNLSEKYGTPTLFIEALSCGHELLRYNEEKHCCWPQIYMESGVWAYYGFSGVIDQGLRMDKRISTDKTIGLAIRRGVIADTLVFGDILAHMR
jgi:hypothetical protein